MQAGLLITDFILAETIVKCNLDVVPYAKAN
jgi:hypothetical protein